MEYRALHLEVDVFPEAGRYTARCEQLRISDHGDTPKAALDALGETLALFIESCLRRGVLAEVLRQNGINDYPAAADAPDVLPLPMLRSTYHDGAGAG